MILAIIALLGLAAAVALLGSRNEQALERAWGQMIALSALGRGARGNLSARLMARQRALEFTRRQVRAAAAAGDRAGADRLAQAGQEFDRQTRLERRRLTTLHRMLSALQRP